MFKISTISKLNHGAHNKGTAIVALWLRGGEWVRGRLAFTNPNTRIAEITNLRIHK